MVALAWVLLMTALLSGCVISINPLYTEETIVFDPQLLGRWDAGGDETWHFEADNPRSYTVTVRDGDERGVLIAHLVQLGEFRFLDLYPEEPDCDFPDIYLAQLIPAHMFFRVDEIGDDQLVINSVDLDWLVEYLDTHPGEIGYTMVDDRPLLTAGTAELQAFFERLAANDEAFDDPDTMERLYVGHEDTWPNFK